MKKLFLSLLVCLPLLIQAQTYDTISGPNGRYYKYHYSSWVDMCNLFRDAQTRSTDHNVPGNTSITYFGLEEWVRINPFGGPVQPPRTPAKTEYVPTPSALKGVAVITTDKTGNPYDGWRYSHPVTDSTSSTLAPDTCVVFNVVNGEMDILGSGRWDTATPKIYKVPWHEDSVHAGYAYFEVFEVYFKSPFMVRDTFYISGTPYNTEVDGNYGYYLHPPHYYAQIGGSPLPGDPCYLSWEEYVEQWLHPSGYWVTWAWDSDKPTVERSILGGMAWGAFLPILSYDSVNLIAVPADRTMGQVTPGSGRVLQWIEHTITAVPNHGYRFTHWNDGNTENPRTVLMDRDSSFTAYFESTPRYRVAVGTDNPEAGHVTGGGFYFDRDTVMIEAIPSSDRYRFSHWDIGETYNPFYFIIRQDTTFTAHFSDVTGIEEVNPEALFTLSPNPTTGKVTVCWGGHTPSPLRGTPPILGGESPRTYPPVDASASSPSMRVVSNGDHEGDEAKSPRSRAASMTKSSRDGGVCIILRDVAGHEVLRKTVSAGSDTVELDLSKLPSGAYFVTLTTPTATATQRLVLK